VKSVHFTIVNNHNFTIVNYFVRSVTGELKSLLYGAKLARKLDLTY